MPPHRIAHRGTHDSHDKLMFSKFNIIDKISKNIAFLRNLRATTPPGWCTLATTRAPVALAFATLLLSACSPKPSTSEKQYLEAQIEKLEAAFAKPKINVADIQVGCITTRNTAALDNDQRRRVEKLCWHDAPKLYLENALRKLRERPAPKELVDLECMDLLVPDALATLAAHPTDDPALRALVTEFTRRCPNVKPQDAMTFDSDQASRARVAQFDAALSSASAALAAGALTSDQRGKISALCMTLPSDPLLDASLRRDATTKCQNDAPKVFLQFALARIRAQPAPHDMPALNCGDIFAAEAQQTLATHPTADAKLRALAAEYDALCPPHTNHKR